MLQRSPGAKTSLTILAILFGIYSVALAYPVCWLLLNSVKGLNEFMGNSIALPKNPLKYLGNYLILFKNDEFPLGKMFLYTLLYALLTPTLNLFMHCIVSYAYAKYNFPLKKFVYFMMVVPMFVFLAGSSAGYYKLLDDLRVYDRLLPYTIITNLGGGGTYFLLFAGMFSNMSDSYREAAMLDGAGRFRIFLTIYMPQATGLLSAMWIMAFIGAWNAFDNFLLYLPSYQTLATGIYTMQSYINSFNSVFYMDYPKLYAAMVCTIIPVFVLFVIFQDTIMQMTFGGGVKG